MNRVPFRAATQAALVLGLLGLIPVPGQNTRSPSGNCQVDKDKEVQVQVNNDLAFSNKSEALEREVERRRAACTGSGSGNKKCLDQVELYNESAIRDLRKQLADEDARHGKAMVDIERSAACAPYTGPMRTPCDRARASEVHRYNSNFASLEKKILDDRNQHQHDLLDCGIRNLPCQRQIEASDQQRQLREELAVAAENRRHENVTKSIDNGVCDSGAEPTREPPDFVSSEGPVDSHEQPKFVGAESAASRMQRMDREIARHAKEEAGIAALMRATLQRHLEALRRPNLSPEAIRSENESYARWTREDQNLLDAERRRFDAAMSRLKGK
jgi:hypothetical protein